MKNRSLPDRYRIRGESRRPLPHRLSLGGAFAIVGIKALAALPPAEACVPYAATADGRYLYVLNAADGSVGAFRAHLDGSLEDLGTVTGLPPLFSRGIAVR